MLSKGGVRVNDWQGMCCMHLLRWCCLQVNDWLRWRCLDVHDLLGWRRLQVNKLQRWCRVQVSDTQRWCSNQVNEPQRWCCLQVTDLQRLCYPAAWQTCWCCSWTRAARHPRSGTDSDHLHDIKTVILYGFTICWATFVVSKANNAEAKTKQTIRRYS